MPRLILAASIIVRLQLQRRVSNITGASKSQSLKTGWSIVNLTALLFLQRQLPPSQQSLFGQRGVTAAGVQNSSAGPRHRLDRRVYEEAVS
jgi:hypothetical protein